LAVIRNFSFYDPATGGNPDQLIYDAMMATRVSGYHQKTLAFIRLTEIMIPYLVAEISGKRGDPDGKGHFIESHNVLEPHCVNPYTLVPLGARNVHWVKFMERVDAYYEQRFRLQFDMVICLDPTFRPPGSELFRLFAHIVDEQHPNGILEPLNLRKFTSGDVHWVHDGETFTHEDWVFTLFGNVLSVSGGDMQTLWMNALGNPPKFRDKAKELADASSGTHKHDDEAVRERFKRNRQRAIDTSTTRRKAKGQDPLKLPKRW
jgi:hypothetical protein